MYFVLLLFFGWDFVMGLESDPWREGETENVRVRAREKRLKHSSSFKEGEKKVRL